MLCGVGVEIMGEYDLFKLKIAALLHDPPHKPFLVVKGRGHEEEAERLANYLFDELISRYLADQRVHDADRLAAVFDRWLLSLIMGDKYISGLFPVKDITLKNIFEPLLEVSISVDGVDIEGKVETYKSKLKDILDDADDWKTKYHLLYAIYELLWILEGLPIGPAETRVPTHTVFDHNYATATMINWTLENGKVRGMLVGIDVAGVQQFISSSRKLRDMWVSSYIVSALTWYLIAELVRALGPDIVIMPSLRMNPFYLHMAFKTMFRDLQQLQKYFDDLWGLIYLSGDIKEMYDSLRMPPYSIMPGRVTLVLPSWDYIRRILGLNEEKDVKQYFMDRLNDGWRLLWKVSRDYAKGYIEEVSGGDAIWYFVDRLFKEYTSQVFSKAGFHIKPPLNIRVDFVEIDSDRLSWELYDKKYRELVAKISGSKYIGRDSSSTLSLYELTRDDVFDKGKAIGYPRSSTKGFEYCTVCGKLPALLVLPDEEEFQKILQEIVKSEKSEELFTIFTPGERLCPWCFLKRVISLQPRILESLLLVISKNEIENFVSSIQREGYRGSFKFPSLSHVASIKLYEKIIEDGGIVDRIVYAVRSNPTLYLPIEPSKLAKLTKFSEEVRYVVWPFMREVMGKLNEIIVALRMDDVSSFFARAILDLEPEIMWFDPDRRSGWYELLVKIGLSKYLWRYYSLIKADGDSIGALLEGRLTAFLYGPINDEFYYKLKFEQRKFDESEEKAKKFIKRYCIESCKGYYKELIESILAGNDTLKWIENISSITGMTVDEARNRVETVSRQLKNVIDECRIPATPAYHVSLSSALMRAALLDTAIICKHNGFVVYAGGDDLLAIAPVDKALDIVFESRRCFAGFGYRKIGSNVLVGEKEGFIRLGATYLPMLSSASKSYAIYIAHYRYPLSYVLKRSADIIEKAKKMLLEYNDEQIFKCGKDVVIIAYNPIGIEDEAIIPLSWKRPIVEDYKQISDSINEIAFFINFVKKIIDCIDKGIISRNFFNDLLQPNLKIILTCLYEKLKDPYLASEAKVTFDNIMKNIIKRNLKVRGDEIEKVLVDVWESDFTRFQEVMLGRWLKSSSIEEEILPELFSLNLFKASRLMISGMR